MCKYKKRKPKSTNNIHELYLISDIKQITGWSPLRLLQMPDCMAGKRKVTFCDVN